MDGHRDIKLNPVASGEYRVNPRAVADAIVRRRWSIVVASQGAQVAPMAWRRWTRPRSSSVDRGEEPTRTHALAA